MPLRARCSTSSGKLAEVRHFVAQNQRRLRASKSAIHRASLPRIGRIALDPQAVISKLRAHLRFLLLETKMGNCDREILRRKEHVAALHHRDADGIQLLVQQIGAMRRGIHPLRVQPLRRRTFGNIFGNHAEARAGLRARSCKGSFAGKLVRERVVLRHAFRVQTRSLGKVGVPMKRGQSRGGAIAIGGVEQDSFGSVRLRACAA